MHIRIKPGDHFKSSVYHRPAAAHSFLKCVELCKLTEKVEKPPWPVQVEDFKGLDAKTGL